MRVPRSKYRLFVSKLFCDRMASIVAMIVGIVASYLFDQYDLELKRCSHVRYFRVVVKNSHIG